VNEESSKSLSGKTILVTGASAGIGVETSISTLLVQLGCNIAFIDGRKRPDAQISLIDNPDALVSYCVISSWAAVLEVFKLTMANLAISTLFAPTLELISRGINISN
jgi:NAD(P)-dependent dehydrogenase (short-subunit alcohol dehydrogenase family)